MRPLLFDDDGSLLVFRGDQLLRTHDGGIQFEPVAGLSQPFSKRLWAHISLSRRLLRLGMHDLVNLADGAKLGTVSGSLVRLEPGGNMFHPVFAIPRGTRPLRLCVTPDGVIYFGDYFGNKDQEEVNIWGSRDGGLSWQVAFRFAPGEVRHVHGVFYDSYRKGCWVLTGDEDPECRILFTANHFKTLDTVVAGSQMARSVTLLPQADGLVTASDTPFEQNYIHLLNPSNGELTQVQAVPGSVFYGSQAGDYQLISTVVEPSKVNTTTCATIWFSKDSRHWKQLVAWPRDRFAGKFFQYAAFHFPRGHNRQNIAYAYGQALSGADGSLLSWDLDAAWASL